MGINVDAKDIKNTIKDIPYKAIVFMVTIISGLLMFLPDVMLDKLFLLELRNKIGLFRGEGG